MRKGRCLSGLRTRRLWWKFVFTGVLVALLTGSAWLLLNLTFPARQERAAGQPYILHIQTGVSQDDVQEVVRDLQLADGFFRSSLGRSTTESIHVKFARFSPCIPFVPLNHSPTAVAQRGEFCLNTAGGGWPQVRDQPAVTLSIIAHEHFHNLQAELGCLPGPNEHEYAWWVEGAATYMGWQTAVHAGRITDEGKRTSLRGWGGYRRDLRPLAEYEHAIPGDAAYALAERAVERLVQRSPPHSLLTFCTLNGQGRPWREAFQQAFNLSADDFYRQFAAQQKRENTEAPSPSQSGV